MKNKIKIIFSYLLILFFFNSAANGEKINNLSNKIKILENGKIISGDGNVEITIDKNIFISYDKFEYNKETGLYKIFNNVKFKDNVNNIKPQDQNLFYQNLKTKLYQKQNLMLFIKTHIILILITLNMILIMKK